MGGASRFALEIVPAAEEELDRLRAHDARSIVDAISNLAWEAETATRNRKPLRKPLAGFPEASWEVRVGDYRVLYVVRKERVVRVLGVIFKGRLALHEAAERSRRE